MRDCRFEVTDAAWPERSRHRSAFSLCISREYDVPRHHPIVGEVAPDTDMVVKALAGKDATRLQPTGAYAANLLLMD